MTDSPDVLSAFLDGEAFDPVELAEVLTRPEARQLLIDIAVMRRLMQAHEGAYSKPAPIPTRTVRHRAFVAGAAAALLAFGGGYVAGGRPQRVAPKPPAATITAEVGSDWQQVTNGGMR